VIAIANSKLDFGLWEQIFYGESDRSAHEEYFSACSVTREWKYKWIVPVVIFWLAVCIWWRPGSLYRTLIILCNRHLSWPIRVCLREFNFFTDVSMIESAQALISVRTEICLC
jgi:hypothetical protein